MSAEATTVGGPRPRPWVVATFWSVSAVAVVIVAGTVPPADEAAVLVALAACLLGFGIGVVALLRARRAWPSVHHRFGLADRHQMTAARADPSLIAALPDRLRAAHLAQLTRQVRMAAVAGPWMLPILLGLVGTPLVGLDADGPPWLTALAVFTSAIWLVLLGCALLWWRRTRRLLARFTGATM